MDDPFAIIEIPKEEAKVFDQMIKTYRKKHIRQAAKVVESVFSKYPQLESQLLKERKASTVIAKAREYAWQEFLLEEAAFNTAVLRELHEKLKTPDVILNDLIKKEVLGKSGVDLIGSIKHICGEYAGKIYPYIYTLSLSNTNSRRSRAGSTFEAIIYQIYSYLKYPFDSQEKVGRKVFENAGLGKKVDSVLPSIAAFGIRRDKVIIGTMKTSLRERWQEVAEEIERTKIPVIHLLTVDTEIPTNKAAEMSAHNIVVVALQDVINTEGLRPVKNIISFEDYFFSEVPNFLEFWKGKL